MTILFVVLVIISSSKQLFADPLLDTSDTSSDGSSLADLYHVIYSSDIISLETFLPGEGLEIRVADDPSSQDAVSSGIEFTVTGATSVAVVFEYEDSSGTTVQSDPTSISMEDASVSTQVSVQIPGEIKHVQKILISFTLEGGADVVTVTDLHTISDLPENESSLPATGQQQVSEPQQEDPLFIPPPGDGTALADPYDEQVEQLTVAPPRFPGFGGEFPILFDGPLPATGQQQASEPQQEDPLFIPPPEDSTALADP